MARSLRNDLVSLHQKAVQLHQGGNLDKAEKLYLKVLKAVPRDGETLGLLGVLRAQQGRHAKAIELLERACALEPASAGLRYNLGKLLTETGNLTEAERQYRECLRLAPESGEAAGNLGAVLARLGHYQEARELLMRATRQAPFNAEAFFNLGIVLTFLHDFTNAERAFAEAVRLIPNDPEALFHLAFCKYWNKKPEAAIEAYTRVLELAPDHEAARSRLLIAKRRICDWRDIAELEDGLLRAIRNPDMGRRASRPRPYAALLTCEDPADSLAAARLAADDLAPKATVTLPPRPRAPRERIRVAYLCADYREHATAFLVAELIELHDRSAFEIIGISFGPDDKSAMRRRFETAFDRFVDLATESPRRIAETVHALDVDIAVDLQGGNQYNRMEIFAHRPAPLQVLYLGWPGTSGSAFHDYVLADRYVAPRHNLQHFSESVVWLPHCYQANDRKRKVAPDVPSRAACGLPEQGVVFCCFNNAFKIRPQMFAVWMRLLDQVPGSVLWLLAGSTPTRANLRREASAHGIDPDRLVFAPHAPNDEHLARHAHADIFLDTLPYNAHTTASDALWQGVPVVTCTGETFAARVATSLVHNLGAPELAAPDLEAYEALALKLARDPGELAQLKAKLLKARNTQPLFDSAGLARSIEAAYREMVARLERGETPSFLDVALTTS